MAVRITLSPTALGEIERLRKAQGAPQGQPIALGLTRGACQPLAYRLKFGELPPPTADAPSANAPVHQVDVGGGITFLIAAEDIPHLQNLHLDYAEDLVGGAFRFQNPNAAEVCGCGASFQPAAPAP
ncbi:MAG: iron-sulfur cluster assembly accessory protein [Cyanobacteria bacterium]|nr:iron-sulfur cluster assembly accessory protein [Cyanobacteriota bacterium]